MTPSVYRFDAGPRSCPRCGAALAAAEAPCVPCARRSQRIVVATVLGVLAGAAVTGGGAAFLMSPGSTRPMPPRAAAPAWTEPSAEPASAEHAPGAAFDVYTRTLALLPGAHPRGELLVVGERVAPGGAPARELALLVDDAVRWRAPLGRGDAVVFTAGVVVTAGPDGLVGRAAATGAEIWRAPGRQDATQLRALEDLVVAYASTAAASPRVQVIEPATGRVRLESTPPLAPPPARARSTNAANDPRDTTRAVFRVADADDWITVAPARASGAAPTVARTSTDPDAPREDLLAGERMLSQDVTLAGHRLVALVPHDALARGTGVRPFALTLAALTPAGLRALLELGDGAWHRPTRDASERAWVVARHDGAGTLYALADRGDEAVLTALESTSLSPRWTRHIRLTDVTGETRDPSPVDLAASPAAVVLALDGGRQLAWFEPHGGTPVDPTASLRVQ